MVDHLGQMLAQAREQVVPRQPAMRHQAVDLIAARALARSPGAICLFGPGLTHELAVSPWPFCCNCLSRSPRPPLMTLPAAPPASSPPNPPGIRLPRPPPP